MCTCKFLTVCYGWKDKGKGVILRHIWGKTDISMTTLESLSLSAIKCIQIHPNTIS